MQFPQLLPKMRECSKRMFLKASDRSRVCDGAMNACTIEKQDFAILFKERGMG